MAKARLTDAELGRRIEEARGRSKIADDSEPRARSARYDAVSGRVEVELTNGCLFAFPAEDTQGLRGASPEQIAQIEVWGDGYALHWEELDADFTVPGLLAGHLGSKAWMSELGRRGGSATSEAKARAARANGARGGRPRATTGEAKTASDAKKPKDISDP